MPAHTLAFWLSSGRLCHTVGMGTTQANIFRQHQTVIDIPGYKIQRTLGKGGMASVYLAIQESFEREVALKVMNPSLSDDSKFSERFLREAKIVSRLVHPNIVTVYDVGVHNHQHYLSMEYIPGFDLKHKRKHLRIRESLQVIKDVARALDYASKKGYVHRDVKPENIMLHDDDGRAVLMDFGIACLSDTASGMTQTGTAIGTPHYMSPEQAKGRAVDPRSDIYSLGVVLFLLVSGRVPFDADSAVAVGIKHVSEDVPRLPQMLRSLQPIIDKVMAKEPADRYQNGIEFIQAIEAIPEAEYKAIELLTIRSINSSLSGNTNTPSALSQAQTAAKSPRNSPDLTTVSAAALQTRNNTRVPGQTSKQATVSSNTANQAVTGQQKSHVRPSRQNTSGKQVPVNAKNATNTSQKTAAVAAANGTTGKQPSLRQSQNAPAVKTGEQKITQKSKTQEEAFYLDEEDRLEHQQEEKPKSRWFLWLAASVLLLGGASVYFRAYFPQPVAGSLDKVVVASVGMKNQVLQSLGFAEPASQEVTSPPVANEQTQNSPQEQNTNSLASTTNNSSNGLGQAGSLREKLNTDLSVAPHLTQLYRDMLEESPGMRNAEMGLRDVREFHQRNIRDAMAKRDLTTAQTYIASLESSFPDELNDDVELATIKQNFENARRAQVHIDKADAYFANNALSVPEGANALASYRQALTIDSNNPLALAGLNNIVNRYAERAQQNYEDGGFVDALQNADRGLAIDNANRTLLKLQEDSSRQLERRSKISALLTAARQQLDAGNLIEPENDSAFARYRELLSFDRGNVDAQNGLSEVEKQIVFKVEGYINLSKFNEAKELANRANELFPGSDRVETMNRHLEMAIEADIISRQPKIPRLLISETQPASIDQAEKSIVNVERVIHVGFSYSNFENDISLIEAKLYDGSRSVEIKTIPVTVTGTEGVKFFQIDRPVEGFGEGGYNIDLFLGEVKLNSLSFMVAKQ